MLKPAAPARDDTKKGSRHGSIVRELGMRIVGGDIQPGERLPSEASMLEHYGVSRPMLREAIRVLVAKGLVLSRQKAGNSVRPRSQWHLLDPDVLTWSIQTWPLDEFVAKLMAMRRIFEPAAASMAAVSATQAQLDAIAQTYAAMEAARTPDELLEPDLAFHRGIADATGNEFIAYIGNMLTLALRESIKLSSKLPNTHALSLPRHKAILTALLNRDPLGARQASLVQLEETVQDLRQVGAKIDPGTLGSGLRIELY
jgi:DNA-binding FadR family transcriptional regulator